KCSTMRARTSKGSHSPCAPWKPGERRSRATSGPTTRRAGGSGFWISNPLRPERKRLECWQAARNSELLPRVLLIDDTPEIAELLSFALRDRGYEVAVSGFTVGIIDLIVEQHPDALVFDCSVYQMSQTLFDAVRGDPNHAGLPIVIISDTP